MNAVISFYEWLFIRPCNTAPDLLALSFAINAIFTGLSLSRYNLCSHVGGMAVWCINRATDDRFLERIEKLHKGHPLLSRCANRFSKTAEGYRKALESKQSKWELVKRIVTILSALLSFVIMAFDPKTRIGFALVLPYFIMIFLHFTYSLFRALWVLFLSAILSLALYCADRKEKPTIKMDDCIAQLKKTRSALSKTKRAKVHK